LAVNSLLLTVNSLYTHPPSDSEGQTIHSQGHIIHSSERGAENSQSENS
jgi:hypothetical protein